MRGYYNLYLNGSGFDYTGEFNTEVICRMSRFGIHNFRLINWELGNAEFLHECAMEAIRSWDFDEVTDNE